MRRSSTQSVTKRSWQRLAFVTYDFLFLKKLWDSEQVFRIYRMSGAWPANEHFGESHLRASLMQHISACDSRDRTMNVCRRSKPQGRAGNRSPQGAFGAFRGAEVLDVSTGAARHNLGASISSRLARLAHCLTSQTAAVPCTQLSLSSHSIVLCS